MTEAFSILSIVLFIVVLLIAAFLYKSFLSNFLYKKPLFALLFSKYLIIIYSAVLIILAIVSYMLPENKLLKQAGNMDTINYQALQEAGQFYDLAKSGKLEQNKNITKNADYTFPIEGNQLEIVLNNNSYCQIWVERKEVDDGKIEVGNYLSPFIAENIDITAKIKPPVINLNGNTMTIAPPVDTINLIVFDRDFAVRQFSLNNIPRQITYSPVMVGNQAIYLRIPKNMQVKAKNSNQNLNLNYISNNL
jgi:hypothetical protein